MGFPLFAARPQYRNPNLHRWIKHRAPHLGYFKPELPALKKRAPTANPPPQKKTHTHTPTHPPTHPDTHTPTHNTHTHTRTTHALWSSCGFGAWKKAAVLGLRRGVLHHRGPALVPEGDHVVAQGPALPAVAVSQKIGLWGLAETRILLNWAALRCPAESLTFSGLNGNPH